MTGARRAYCDCCTPEGEDIWCCYENAEDEWVCEEMAQEDCKGVYGGTPYETEVDCGDVCEEVTQPCKDPSWQDQPVECFVLPDGLDCDIINTTNACDGATCNDMEATISGDIVQNFAHLHPDYECDCGEISECDDDFDFMCGTWPSASGVTHCHGIMQMESAPGDYCGSTMQCYITRPTPLLVPDAGIGATATVTWSNSATGSYYEDPVLVTAQAGLNGIIIRYTYDDGTCKAVLIRQYGNVDLACNKDCVAAQTDEAGVYAMGVTLSGDSTQICQEVIDGSVQTISSGGSATINYKRSHKCFFEMSGQFEFDPPSCEQKGNCCCVATFSMRSTTFYQRLSTTDPWGGVATCAYNYSFDITAQSSEIGSLSVSIASV